MTIYILDDNPVECAKMLDDKSLNKMIKDIAQVLCNVHEERLNKAFKIINEAKIAEDEELRKNMSFYQMEQLIKYDEDIPLQYKTNKFLLEWSLWARKCKANYLYLVELGVTLCDEHACRFYKKEKPHKIIKYESTIAWAKDNIPDLPSCINKEKCCTPECRKTSCFWDRETRPVPLIMPKKYYSIYSKQYTRWNSGKSLHDIVSLYRNYYQAKLRQKPACFIKYTNRTKPEWITL